MMFRDGAGLSGWGYVLMTANMLLFWALLIIGVVVLIRVGARDGRRAAKRPGQQASPEDLLAQRFARGEIDEYVLPQAPGCAPPRTGPLSKP